MHNCVFRQTLYFTNKNKNKQTKQKTQRKITGSVVEHDPNYTKKVKKNGMWVISSVCVIVAVTHFGLSACMTVSLNSRTLFKK